MACERHLVRFSGHCVATGLRAVAVSARQLQRMLRASVLNVPNHRRVSAVSPVRSLASACRFAFARHLFVGQRAVLGRAALPFVLPNLALNRTLRDEAAQLRLASR